MEFDLAKTVALFAVLIAVGVGGLIAAPMMQTATVVMMVLPSMVVFGGVCLFLGVKHGEYRAAR